MVSHASLVVESASHLSIWIIGMCAAIYFLQKFESELKPLIMAAVFVGILETIVQWFEWLMQKTALLVRLLAWKWWQLTGFAILEVCQCPRHDRETNELARSIVHDWRDLFRRWENRDAGSSSIFRMLAVVLTLLGVGFAVLGCWGLLEQQVQAVLEKIDLYVHQVTAMTAFIALKLPDLALLAPTAYRAQASKAILHSMKSFQVAMQGLPAILQSYAIGALNYIVSTTSGSIMNLIFFLLYCAFMLFDPLHINVDDHEHRHQEEKRSHTMANGWLWKISKRYGKKVGLSLNNSVTNMMKPRAGAGSSGDGAENGGSMPVWYSNSLKVKFNEDDDDDEGGRSTSADPVGRTATDKGEDSLKLLELQHFIYRIVWHYFVCMVVLNIIFAGSVFVLLECLAVDLSLVIALVCFFLSFIPELGTLISMLLPVPFTLLTPTEWCTTYHLGSALEGVSANGSDCIADFGDRLKKLVFVIVGMLLIKLLVANVLNAIIMGRNKWLAGGFQEDQEVTETHGVLVLFAVVFFGKVWGTVGMLISVPLLSIFRLTINIGLERGRQRDSANTTKKDDKVRRPTIMNRVENMLHARKEAEASASIHRIASPHRPFEV